MDLAKAVAGGPIHRVPEELILVPASYGAAVAAASAQALLLDPTEDTWIVPQPPPNHHHHHHHPQQSLSVTQQTPLLQHRSTTIVSLEPNLFRTASSESSLLAATALALDHVYRGTSNEDIESLLERAVQCLQQLQQPQPQGKNAKESVLEEQHNAVMEIMYATGASMSYGLNEEYRSIPLALAASLIPSSFPQYSITAFWSSLVPAYCHELLERPQQCSPRMLELVRSISHVSAPTMVTNESFQTLLLHIYANQALWNCRDCSSSDFRNLLRNHLLV